MSDFSPEGLCVGVSLRIFGGDFATLFVSLRMTGPLSERAVPPDNFLKSPSSAALLDRLLRPNNVLEERSLFPSPTGEGNGALDIVTLLGKTFMSLVGGYESNEGSTVEVECEFEPVGRWSEREAEMGGTIHEQTPAKPRVPERGGDGFVYGR